jgi:hypothetical protein
VLALHRSTLRTAVARAGQQHRRKYATAARIRSAASQAPAAVAGAAQAAAAGQRGKAGVAKQFRGLTPEQRQVVQRRRVAVFLTARGRHGRNLLKLRAQALVALRAKGRSGQQKLSNKQVRQLKSQLAKALLMQQLRLLQKPTSTEAKPSKLWQGPQHRSVAQIIADKVRQVSDSTAASYRAPKGDAAVCTGAQGVMQRLAQGLKVLAATTSTDADCTVTDTSDADGTDTDGFAAAAFAADTLYLFEEEFQLPSFIPLGVTPDSSRNTQAAAAAAAAAGADTASADATTAKQQQTPQRYQHKVVMSLDAFLPRAASPGVLLQVLQHYELSAGQCSLAYLRLSQLCRTNPALLQHPSTVRLLQLLRVELPRLPNSCRPWQLAVMTAAGQQLQQPQLVRISLAHLLQHKETDAVQLLLSAAACLRAQQLPLARVMLRLLLLQGAQQLVAASPRAAAAGLANFLQRIGPQLDTEAPQQLLSTLLELQDGSMPQLTAAVWAAASIAPQRQDSLQQLLHAFLQLLPGAPPAEVAVVLRAASYAGLQMSGTQVQLLLAAIEQQLPAASIVDIRIALDAAVLISLRQKLPIWHTQLEALLSAWEQHLHAAGPEDIARMLSGLAAAGHKIRNVRLQQLLSRFLEVLPDASHWQIAAVLEAVASLGLSVPITPLQQLLEAFMERVSEAAAPLSTCTVVHAVVSMNKAFVLTQEQLQRCDEVWAQAWPEAPAKDWPRYYRTLWACSQAGFMPYSFLKAADSMASDKTSQRAKAATIEQLSSVISSFARLGRHKALLHVFIQEALSRLQDQGVQALGPQAAANLCWAVAVLNKGRKKRQITIFAAACAEQWDALGVQEKQMLHQVGVRASSFSFCCFESFFCLSVTGWVGFFDVIDTGTMCQHIDACGGLHRILASCRDSAQGQSNCQGMRHSARTARCQVCVKLIMCAYLTHAGAPYEADACAHRAATWSERRAEWPAAE